MSTSISDMIQFRPTKVQEDASTSLDVEAGSYDDEALKNAIREAIIAEYDATNMYMKIAASIQGHDDIAKLFRDVAKEENVHVGEFMAALGKLDPEELKDYQDGQSEAIDKMTGKSSE